jgi:hypothetical protein
MKKMKKLYFITIMIVLSIGLFADGDVEGFITYLEGSPAQGIWVGFYAWDYTYSQWYEYDFVPTDANGWFTIDLKQEDIDPTSCLLKVEAYNPNGTNPRKFYYSWPGYIRCDLTLMGYIEP